MTIFKTRFKEIGVHQTHENEWRFVCIETGKEVGPHYKGKLEIYSDLTRYAKDSWGIG